MRLHALSILLLTPAVSFAQDLTLHGECPGTIDIDLSGLTPGGSYALMTADFAGAAVMPGGPCAGTPLGLDTTGLALRTVRSADLTGADSMSPNLPLSACGMAMQVVDLTTCTTTPYDFLPRPVTPTTITDVQTGAHTTYDVVQVDGIVTAAGADGLWIQESGPSLPNSGVYVYLDADWQLTWGAVIPGDTVTIQGEYREYFDLTEINVVNSPSGLVTVTGVDVVPAPAVVPLADLATNPEPWEGVLVQVQNVSVAGVPNPFGEWLITDGVDDLMVDDHLYLPAGLTIGQTFTSITGPLHYDFGLFQLLPRNAGDLL